MFKSVSSKNYAIPYIISVLLATWLLTIVLSADSSGLTKSFQVIMFVPLVMANIFNSIQRKSKAEKLACFTNKINFRSMFFGVFYPLVFISLCAVISIFSKLGSVDSQSTFITNGFKTTIVAIFVGFLGALGEEYGWRGFLLPELLKKYSRVKSSVIVGVVWALYHAPMVFILAKTNGIDHPVLLCLIQAGCAFATNFAFSYCYFLSKNIIPVLLLHSIWNTINSSILGDIYTNKQGVLKGNLLLINGEGIVGLILSTILCLLFIKLIKKSKLIAE